MTEPIKPNKVVDAKRFQPPDEVIEAFNVLITENFRGKESQFTQAAVLKEIIIRLKESDRKDLKIYSKKDDNTLKSLVYINHWLDIEDTYREAGWIVIYDKPPYNENQYEPTFTFRKPK